MLCQCKLAWCHPHWKELLCPCSRAERRNLTSISLWRISPWVTDSYLRPKTVFLQGNRHWPLWLRWSTEVRAYHISFSSYTCTCFCRYWWLFAINELVMLIAFSSMLFGDRLGQTINSVTVRHWVRRLWCNCWEKSINLLASTHVEQNFLELMVGLGDIPSLTLVQ